MIQKIDTDIKTIFKKIGVNKTQALLYLSLLQLGPLSITLLSKKTDIPRTTTYENVNKLIEKGLITKTSIKGRSKLVAEKPNKIKLLLLDKELELENKQRDLNKLKRNLPGYINQIYDLIPNSFSSNQVNVKYYEGNEAVWQVYKETLIVDDYYSFADLDKYYEVFPDTLDYWIKALKDNPNRKVRDILLPSETAQEVCMLEVDRYYTKIIPEECIDKTLNFADHIIYEDKVAIIQLDRIQSFATVIQSKHVAHSLLTLHKVIWQYLP